MERVQTSQEPIDHRPFALRFPRCILRRRHTPGRTNMTTMRILAAAAFASAIAVTAVSAQQPQTQRVRGTIEKVDGNTLLIKSSGGGALVTLTLTDNALV